MRTFTIAGRLIADDEPCYVIAEMSGNHEGSVEKASELIRAAARAGASAVKFVKRDPETLFTRAVREQPYQHEHSFGATYGEHRTALELDEAAYQSLLTVAAANQTTLLATAFDEPSADLLVRLQVPAIKIHSGGLTDRPLLQHVASLGKPIILSTGGGVLEDIDRAVTLLNGGPLAILHCTASYPLRPDEANLRVIPLLRRRYPQHVIGWSSHHTGLALSLVAYALGARIIEHHFTLDRAGKGTDHAFSLEPKGLATLIDDLEKTRLALGDGVKRFYLSERMPIAKMRRVETAEGWRIAR